MLDTFGRTGARVGLIWICLVGLCAIFAPILANSFPILIKIDGKWSSPMFDRLTYIDLTLLGAFAAVAVLYFLRRRIDLRTRVITFASLIAVMLIAGYFIIRPPLTTIYDRYRVAAAEGRVQWVLNAPIPYSPSDRLRDQFDAERPHPWAPSRQHWLGTDAFGSDILSNILHACRAAMSIGFISTGVALVIAILVGGMMGYFAGWVDLLGMRLVEIFSAIPRLYLLLAVVAYYRDSQFDSIYLVMIIIGLTGWTGDARFVRAEFLKLRRQDFVHAAVAVGLPLRRVLWRHILPNAMAPLLVSTSFGIADAVLTESTLSFLGLGAPDQASWGRILDQARGAGGGFYWWLALFPGLAIFFTVLAYNLIGESLRDALDPKLRGIE